jgi:hypothetical protein
MPSKEYYEGRDMEKNKLLHEYLIDFFKFDEIDSDGSTRTKSDVIGIKDGKKICLSVKNASGKNTQVHLTTLKKLASDLDLPQDIVAKLTLWFGTNDISQFNLWSAGKNLSTYELGHDRLASNNIENWNIVTEWFNTNNRKIASLIIESLKNGEKSEFLVWNNKVENCLQIVDVPKLIDFIEKECTWITMPSGTILRCITSDNKPILWLQMKGNHTDEGYNRCPQFHLVENWPNEIVLSKQIVTL